MTGGIDGILAREGRNRTRLSEQVRKIAVESGLPPARTVPAADIPRRNFIDSFIFGRLQDRDVPSAALSTDEEFLRRIHYDLTGRPPSPADIRAFLADTSPFKRDTVIDTLLYAREFSDRWTLWLGDLLKNVAFPANFNRQYKGRNAFYEWMLLAIDQQKPLREIAFDSIASTGNSYDRATGGVNFALNAIVAMGPIQDRYDNFLVQAASTWLGLSHYDCLLCHSGRGHLEQVSLWGVQTTRLDALRMAAFFSRADMTHPRVQNGDQYYDSYHITDRASGGYELNTSHGNRPNRAPIGSNLSLTPEYRLAEKAPADSNWRRAFASYMVDDPLFALNLANRIWKEMFLLPLVDPVDGLDPARLDPENPPPSPWTLQAAHPELLVWLAGDLKERNYNLREFLRQIVSSSAYQLSSRYDGQWNASLLPLYPRHYPRRLEAEEIHDAIVLATGVETVYRVDTLDATPWAMRMPDPTEPRNTRATLNFLAPFYRGDRDSFFRIQDGSILQQLTLMNDTFVLNRLRVASSPRLREVSALETNDAVIDELFLRILQRRPLERERRSLSTYLGGAGNQRNTYIEDVAWVLINKIDFLFNW